jgi:DNA-directed RNA polymerase specialized sigma24 family protein
VLLVLHYLQGLSYREIADVTGEPTGTVKWRIRLALDRMRTLLTAEKPHVPSPAGERRDP